MSNAVRKSHDVESWLKCSSLMYDAVFTALVKSMRGPIDVTVAAAAAAIGV